MERPKNHISKTFLLDPECYWIESNENYRFFLDVFLPLVDMNISYGGLYSEIVESVQIDPGSYDWESLLNPIDPNSIASVIAHEVLVMSDIYYRHYLDTHLLEENINIRGYGSRYQQIGAFLSVDKTYVVRMHFQPDPWDPGSTKRSDMVDWNWVWQIYCNETYLHEDMGLDWILSSQIGD